MAASRIQGWSEGWMVDRWLHMLRVRFQSQQLPGRDQDRHLNETEEMLMRIELNGTTQKFSLDNL